MNKWKEFAHWVAKQVINEENWEENNYKDAFPELALRKLYKLGIVEKDEESWYYEDEYDRV